MLNLARQLCGMVLAFFCGVNGALWASANAADRHLLEEIVVTATRLPALASKLPVAVSVISQDEIQLGRQQLGLDESLARVPGLFFQNRYNFAQDLRISIRGFGARANFGIRGIRIFVDDIPLTLPDGQSGVDALDLGTAQQIEVIRGPYSAVYGASTGGVINIRSEDGPDQPTISGRVNVGAYDYRQWQIKAGGQHGSLNWLANGSATELGGYRDHAALESDLFNAKLFYDFDADTRLTLVVNAVDSPLADDPGGLNAGEVIEDRRQAAPRNVAFNAGEALEQQTVGLSFRTQFSAHHGLMLRTYHVSREFSNRLPFDVNSNGQGGSVDLDRRFSGLGGNYSWTPAGGAPGLKTLVIGFDYDALRDHRRRFANDLGVLGALTTDQDEDVTARGLYAQAVFSLPQAVELTLGARYDKLKYEIGNRLDAESGSGDINFKAFSPLAGLSWAVSEGLNVYANVSESFDSPATTELANPVGPSGFNANLDPQTATNYEIGLKGLAHEKIRYELALFHINVKDALVPFELAGSGQTFFENAGRSTHRGLEATTTFQLADGLTGTLSYTWSDFSFDEFSDSNGTSFDGNRIPGIPQHLIFAELNWRHDTGFYAVADVVFAGEFYADNANSTGTESSAVMNLRAGWEIEAESWSFAPFIGINNLLAEKYFSNVRLNASFGRYWEPAPERNLYAGARLSWRF